MISDPAIPDNPIQRLLDALRSHKCNPVRSDNGWEALCPAHEDHNPSLSIGISNDGKALIHCHAGCSPEKVVEAIGLNMTDLFPGSGKSHRKESKRTTKHSLPDKSGNGTHWRNLYPISEEKLQELACNLGVSTSSLKAIGVGWSKDDSAWTIPEFRDGGKGIGFNRRFLDGSQKMMAGNKRGLIVALKMENLQEPILIVEGMSDVAACTTMGITAVGRPTAFWSVDGLNTLCKDHQVIAIGEFDQKSDGSWPGRDGAISVAEKMAQHRKKPVDWALPPDGTKDVRAWLNQQQVDLDDNAACRELGKIFLQSLQINSIPAPKERDLARNEIPDPVPISELGSGEPPAWIWDNFILQGGITLLSGYPKKGKSTLISHVITLMNKGGEMGGTIKPGRVLVISEEIPHLWVMRKEELGIGDHVECLCRPFKGRPTHDQWEDFVDRVAIWIKERKYDLVIFDTLASMSPVDDENVATAMLRALTPLQRISEAGAAVLLIHHLRKSDASEGMGSRGSNSLTGFVDVILELRGIKNASDQDPRRVLTTLSRFTAQSEVVLELGDSGYRAIGTQSDASQEDRLDVIQGILPLKPTGQTSEDVAKFWPEGGSVLKPCNRILREDLVHGSKTGRWQKTGNGVKGNPFRYHTSPSAPNSILASPLSKGAGKKNPPPSDNSA